MTSSDRPEGMHRTGSIAAGPVSMIVVDGDPRRILFGKTEVLRRLSYPVRDENWGTCTTLTTDETLRHDPDGAEYRHDFRAADGSFDGNFTLRIDVAASSARLRASLTIRPLRDFRTNRAGFTLLHPIAGVAGQPLAATRPEGTVDHLCFPSTISPGQPAVAIAGLEHRVEGVTVRITMTGETFEMEDQRNWSDASFKTYCRPLSAPRPYTLSPGNEVRQDVEITLSGTSGAQALPTRITASGRCPTIALACEPGLSTTTALPGVAGLPVLLRLRADADVSLPGPLPASEVALEIVLPDGADPAGRFAAVARCCQAAGLRPTRAVALPETYLQSHQPGGPWPAGPAPADLLAPLRAAFPGVMVGSGSLTLFTEFNRCPPAPDSDFATFGSAAIVHAADDLSVLETLEALPDIFDSARALAPGKPLHLGLLSIGMRSNPYGAGLAPNPHRRRLTMTADDPRQQTRLAAAWAVGVLAAAATHGVASLALAMPDGPLGCLTQTGVTPLYHVIRAASALAGQDIRITRNGGLIGLHGGRSALLANLGPSATDAAPSHDRHRLLNEAALTDAGSADWADNADAPQPVVRLEPFDILFCRSPA